MLYRGSPGLPAGAGPGLLVATAGASVTLALLPSLACSQARLLQSLVLPPLLLGVSGYQLRAQVPCSTSCRGGRNGSVVVSPSAAHESQLPQGNPWQLLTLTGHQGTGQSMVRQPISGPYSFPSKLVYTQPCSNEQQWLGASGRAGHTKGAGWRRYQQPLQTTQPAHAVAAEHTRRWGPAQHG
jgi:hypothetical protein